MAKNEVIENEGMEEKKEGNVEAKNMLELLLGADLGTIKMPHKDMEISRLSEILGAPFIVRCNALSQDKHEELQDMAVDIRGKDVDLDVNQLQIMTIIEGVEALVPNEKGELVAAGLLLKNNELKAKFKAATPKDLAKALFMPGEIAKLYGAISELSGFSDEAVKEVKN